MPGLTLLEPTSTSVKSVWLYVELVGLIAATLQGSSQPAADPPPQAETLPAGRQEGRRDRVQPDSPPEVQQLPEALRALYTTHVQELSKLSASADASSQQYFMSYKVRLPRAAMLRAALPTTATPVLSLRAHGRLMHGCTLDSAAAGG